MFSVYLSNVSCKFIHQYQMFIWRFPKMGVPQYLDDLLGKSPSKIDDLRVPPFMETPKWIQTPNESTIIINNPTFSGVSSTVDLHVLRPPLAPSSLVAAEAFLHAWHWKCRSLGPWDLRVSTAHWVVFENIVPWFLHLNHETSKSFSQVFQHSTYHWIIENIQHSRVFTSCYGYLMTSVS